MQLVREVLVELELPHIQVTTGRGSSKRQILFDALGRFQIPFLEVRDGERMLAPLHCMCSGSWVCMLAWRT